LSKFDVPKIPVLNVYIIFFDSEKSIIGLLQ
jgi:hypothetical protein